MKRQFNQICSNLVLYIQSPNHTLSPSKPLYTKQLIIIKHPNDELLFESMHSWDWKGHFPTKLVILRKRYFFKKDDTNLIAPPSLLPPSSFLKMTYKKMVFYCWHNICSFVWLWICFWESTKMILNFLIEPNLKKTLKQIQSYEDTSFLGPLVFIWGKQESFQKNHWYIFHVEYLQNILRVGPELWGCIIFGPKMANMSNIRAFIRKTINTTLTYLLTCFNMYILTKNP